MITKIVAALNTGFPSVKCVAFGHAGKKQAPYCVVKQEEHIRGTGYRIIAHFNKGQQTYLEDYIRGTVSNILDDFDTQDRHGNNQRLFYDYDDPLPRLIVNNDDDTISMERVYYKPDIFF